MSTLIRERNGKRVFIRFAPAQRIEHVVQVISFTTLVVTGIAQKYSTYAAGEWVIGVLGGIEMTRAIHRTMGVVLIIESIVHIALIVRSILQGKRKFDMLPNLQDARDAMQMVLYFIGVRKHRARFGRFDFRQKSEYWSLVWGTVVMIITGSMMWFPVYATKVFPGEMIPAARVAHSGEGLLAFLAILIWHMYSAHLSPDVFPFDKTIFNGEISEERMIHEHPLEYEMLMARHEAAAESSDVGEANPD